MSTIKALVPYRIETFRSGPAQPCGGNTRQQEERHHAAPRAARASAPPARSPAFLVQLMVQSDADLRKNLGRQEIAQARLHAYAGAQANRPGAQELRFVQELGRA